MHCSCNIKVGAKGPGCPFVILLILYAHLFCVKDTSGTTFPRNLKFGTNDKYDYRIRPNYRTVRLGFSKLLGTLRCDKICTYTY